MCFLSKYICTFFAVCVLALGSYGATHPFHPKDVEVKMKEGNYSEAKNMLEKHIAYYKTNEVDSLATYIPLTGLIYLKEEGDIRAEKKVTELADFVLDHSKNTKTKVKSLSFQAEFFSNLSVEKKAYNSYQMAQKIIAREDPGDYYLRAEVENNMAVTAYRMNDMPLSAKHNQKAEQWIHMSPDPDADLLYSIHNSKASVFYFSYRLDSAEIYYRKALSDLQNSKKDSLSKKYSEAIIHNNLAGIYSIRDEKEPGIASMKIVIESLSYYNERVDDVAKSIKGKEFLYEGIDNLAGIYRSLGDYHKGVNLLHYAYDKKRQNLPEGSSAVFKSEILLGQALFDLGNIKTAEEYLVKGIDKIPASGSGYLFWEADGYATRAQISELMGKKEQAVVFYNRADSIYQVALGGQPDNIYLEFLNNRALYYAGLGQYGKAEAISRKGLNYMSQQDGENSSLAAKGYINLSKIALMGTDYENTEQYSKKALQILDGLLKSSSGKILDSIGLEMEKPNALLLNQKAKYYSSKNITPSEIDNIIATLSQAQDILQRRISILNAEEGWRSAMEVQGDILQFINRLNLKKYELLKDEKVIDDIIQTQERSVYKRIRNNLNRQKSIQLINVPDEVLQEETAIKEKLNHILQEDEGAMAAFMQAEKEWDEFQTRLKKEYPHYYHARYNTDDTWKESKIWKNIPSDMSVVRYFYIDDSLYALVLQREGRSWVNLGNLNLESEMHVLTDFRRNEQDFCRSAFSIYKKIWAPLKRKINHKRVMVIPDRNLYHISFEMLPEKDAKNMEELAANALLHRYAFSYHYSLMALQEDGKQYKNKKSFVAFTPAFSNTEKAPFRQASNAWSSVEHEEYLNLLPLPFSVALAKKVGRVYGGTSFTGTQCTKEKFIRFSSGHSIIHLGTHAVANNDYPEYSKLIFAKDPSDPDADNAVYLYDLYGYDLSSDISVLTACETGKSGAFPGEGMISMAHAFMYAGSKSILTGLWEIDEQMTVKIVEEFYQHLSDGLPKDVALQQAKLKYLTESSGRLFHPQYWAGMVLMGDVSPIPSVGQSWWQKNKWLVFSALLFITLVFLLRGKIANGVNSYKRR